MRRAAPWAAGAFLGFFASWGGFLVHPVVGAALIVATVVCTILAIDRLIDIRLTVAEVRAQRRHDHQTHDDHDAARRFEADTTTLWAELGRHGATDLVRRIVQQHPDAEGAWHDASPALLDAVHAACRELDRLDVPARPDVLHAVVCEMAAEQRFIAYRKRVLATGARSEQSALQAHLRTEGQDWQAHAPMLARLLHEKGIERSPRQLLASLRAEMDLRGLADATRTGPQR